MKDNDTLLKEVQNASDSLNQAVQFVMERSENLTSKINQYMESRTGVHSEKVEIVPKLERFSQENGYDTVEDARN